MRSGWKSGDRGHGSTRDKAGSTVDWPPLRWIKGHRRLLAALSAGHVHFYFLFGSRNLGRGDSRQSVVLGLLARLAPFGLVLQTLVVEEDLLAHGPHELFTAIDASDRSIREFRCPAVRRPLQLNVWHAVHLPARLRRGNVGKLFTFVTSKKLTRRPTNAG
jgi:hypothetical protein